jgi:CRP/FNR family cyclic AMP-dependent transcriptional regulator
MSNDINFLRNVSIFEELPERDLEKIAKLGTRKKFSKGNIILMEDEIGSALFIIIDGKVKVSRLDETGKRSGAFNTWSRGGLRGNVLT